MYHLLRGLARRYEVRCLTFAPDEAAAAALEPLHEHCYLSVVPGPPARTLARRAWTTLASPLPDMALRNAAADYTRELDHLLTMQHYDVILAESIEMAGYGLHPAPGQNPLRLLDQFNAEYVLQKRTALTDLHKLWRPAVPHPRALAGVAYSLAQWGKLAAYEQRMLPRFDHVVVVSAEDQRALQQLAPNTSLSLPVVPNGVDTAFFVPGAVAPDPAIAHGNQAGSELLLFTGTLNFRPNVDALLWFVQQVLPLVWAQRPGVRFLMVGRSPAPAVQALHNGTRLLVAGDVPDVRPAMAAAAAYVVPMRMGGGIRLKLLEALAMQLPVVSTSMGAEGVPELRDGEHLLLADSPRDFAAALLRLLVAPALREQLGTQGRALAAAHYDWSVIVPRLTAVWEDTAFQANAK